MLAGQEVKVIQEPVAPGFGVSKILDKLDLAKVSKKLVVFNPSVVSFCTTLNEATNKVKGLAGIGIVKKVVTHNPDSLWGICRRSRNAEGENSSEGFVAFLMLNAEGRRRLLTNTFDASDPDLNLLTAQNEKPAAIYVWALYAPGPIAGGIALVFEKISSPLYKDVTLYARPATESGRRFLETIGFAAQRDEGYGDIYAFQRTTPPARHPLYDSYHPGSDHKAISVTVAHSIEDIFRIMSVRSAVYMGEQHCPYEEEFDGNDFAASHLLGYIGSEPAGCLRIRFFAGFAKIERLAVRAEFRKTRLAFDLVRAGIELGRVKGYRKFYGHAQKRLTNFWGRFGFKSLENGSELVFSDFDYVEMVMDTEQHPLAMEIGCNPYKIIRPEGRWHIPSILERSADRPVTRPSVDKDTASAA